MFPLVVLFLLLPIAELYVIVQVASGIGVLNTLGVLILVSLVGAWLIRREGFGLLERIQRQLSEGKLPAKELVDGFLVLLAGALLLTPGFLTDAVGILLLLPPVRAVMRAALLRRYRHRIEAGMPMGGGRSGFRVWSTQVYDVTGRDSSSPNPTRPDPPALP